MLVAMGVFGLLTAFLAQFYVLMTHTYEEVSVHSDMQRTMRNISNWIFREVRESAPSSESNLPILEPTSTTTTSTMLRFTRPQDLLNPRSPVFETIRYYYDSNNKQLMRGIEGSADADRVIAEGITTLSFTWINDYKIRLDFTITRDIGTRTVTSNGEVYLATRYRP
ncbi:MAG: hypothetical protein M1269_02340 [Chloroflexi bacterium]|nr:hypothetical protein [Chloroflexota bacterium]